MKTIKLLLLLIFLAGCSKSGNKIPAVPDTIVDDIGVKVTIKPVPQRVITLAPNLTEMIYELGEGSKLVGNTTYCNFPPQAKLVEKVGNMLTVDYEKIVSLKPDLIFMTVVGNSKNSYDKLKDLGMSVFVSNPKTFSGINKTFLDMGKIFNKEKFAKEKISQWDSVINYTKNKSAGIQNNKVMFLVSLRPIMLAGKNTFINEIIETAGLKNIANDTKVNYPVYSREEVLKKNPDYIILFENKNLTANAVKSAYEEWSELNASKQNHIIFVDPDLFARPGPRYYLAVEFLYNKIHRQHK